MDPLLLKYYNRELQFIRDVGGEFAREHPKIAGRLSLNEFECSDPYVERLLEGFAFLAARVHLKLDAEFPRFTEHLLEMVYPHYLYPTPSMTVVQFQPDPDEGSLAEGYRMPRGTALRSLLGKGEQTACEYRTSHETTLWPLKVEQAEYSSREAVTIRLPRQFQNARAVLRLTLQATAGLTFDQLNLDQLDIFLRGGELRTARLYEQLLADRMGVVISKRNDPKSFVVLPKQSLKRKGFAPEDALLPYGERSFQGYRLLQEYFAFPQRFMFVDLHGLKGPFKQLGGSEIDILIPLDKAQQVLEGQVNATNFGLYCVPAINLFPKRADRIHLDTQDHEHHVVVDRTRPMDFEVHSITGMMGFGVDSNQRQTFRNFYAQRDADDDQQALGKPAYYTVRRSPRLRSTQQQRDGARSSYMGTEVFVSLADPAFPPLDPRITQIEAMTLCSNRDLPLQMPVGRGVTDFMLGVGAPVKSIRCVAGPTEPKPSLVSAAGNNAWRLISHLSLNYLSLTDSQFGGGATALRELLGLYSEITEVSAKKQVEGLRSVRSESIIRRMSSHGPLTFGRGQQITVTCDESAFDSTGVFLMGAVLAEFFARYVSINSFTETVLKTTERGEVMRWPTQPGTRQVL